MTIIPFGSTLSGVRRNYSPISDREPCCQLQSRRLSARDALNGEEEGEGVRYQGKGYMGAYPWGQRLPGLS